MTAAGGPGSEAVMQQPWTPLLRGALAAAITIDSAMAGGLQVVESENRLRMRCTIGLPDAWARHFALIDFDWPTTCAQACLERRRVVIRDILADARSAPILPQVNEAGVRAMQSIPLFDSHHRLRGAMSTQFGRPHHPGPDSLREFDRCGRVAGLALEAEALCAERDARMPAAAEYALDAAVRMIGTVTSRNRGVVLDAVAANLDVVVGELAAAEDGETAAA